MTDKKNKVTSDNHRINNVWDVTYDPDVDIDNFIKISLYDVPELSSNHKQFQSYVIDLSYEKQDAPEETLDSVKEKAERVYIDGIRFSTCDFIGGNEGKKITFRDCYFDKSYFGYSCLKDVNFESCNFSKSSFSLTKFFRCRFDETCVFSDISISGGKTIFTESVVSAEKLLGAVYIYATKDYCKKNIGKKVEQERAKMYSSMVKLSRNILESVSKNGDDEYYYSAVKQVYKLKIKEGHHKKIWENKRSAPKGFLRKIGSLLYRCVLTCAMPVETVLLNTLGFLNGWGASVSRCTLFGALILISFSSIYYFTGVQLEEGANSAFSHVIKSIIQSFDITFLAGYTKYVNAKDDYGLQLVCLLNMLLGLTWYAISIPTIINKISTNRI